MPTIDPEIVRLSGAAVKRYGPDFTYSPYIGVRRLPAAVGLAGGVSALFTLAQVAPARKLISAASRRAPGPSPEQRAKGWFKVDFIGEGGGEKVHTRVSGGDPGYGETSKMLAESALSLAHDDLPEIGRPGHHRAGDGRRAARPPRPRRHPLRRPLSVTPA